MKHTVNGDQIAGWYCYQCHFFTRNVDEAAAHDGSNDETEIELCERLTGHSEVKGTGFCRCTHAMYD